MAQTLLSSADISKRRVKLSRNVSSVFPAGGTRSSSSGGAGDCLWGSGSTTNWRFRKGSEEEDLSVFRLRATPVLCICKLSVPVHAGGAGEPPVPRASLAPLLQSGVLAAARSRVVVRRSSGAVATDWWSPFMVMILGINRGRGAQVPEKSQVCRREENFVQ